MLVLKYLRSKGRKTTVLAKRKILTSRKPTKETLNVNDIVADQFKTGQWLSNQNQPLLWLVKGSR